MGFGNEYFWVSESFLFSNFQSPLGEASSEMKCTYGKVESPQRDPEYMIEGADVMPERGFESSPHVLKKSDLDSIQPPHFSCDHFNTISFIQHSGPL